MRGDVRKNYFFIFLKTLLLSSLEPLFAEADFIETSGELQEANAHEVH